MAIYISYNALGAIAAWWDWPAPGSTLADFEITVVNGRAYKKGEEPPSPQPTLEDQLAALKSSYDTKLAALDLSLQNALWADGTQEAATRAALSAKRTALIRERSAAIKALTGK